MADQDLGNSNTRNCKSFCESFLKTWNAGESTSRNDTGLNKILASSTSGFYMVKHTLWDVAFFGMISPNFSEHNKGIPTNATLACYSKMRLNSLCQMLPILWFQQDQMTAHNARKLANIL
jgi:hypothetical protein